MLEIARDGERRRAKVVVCLGEGLNEDSSHCLRKDGRGSWMEMNANGEAEIVGVIDL